MNTLNKIKFEIFYMIQLLIVFLVISCNHKSKEQIAYEKHNNNIKAIIKAIEAENINHVIKNQLVYYGLDSLNRTKLSDFVKSSRLFLYFSANTCGPCIDHTIDILKECYPDYFVNEKIVFVSPDYPARYRINCYGKKLLNLENNKLGLPLEIKTEPPFFIVIDSTMQVTSIHVVNKMDFDRTEKYLKEIRSSYDFK